MPPATSAKYLDPAALARLKNMGLAARLVVDGLFSGQHKSPRKGFSIEFAEHREYSPGVDPRHLDWKILAKRDKLYVKQYEEQTNLRGYLLVDTSGSMGYKHSGELTKLEYASYCAASLAYLMQSQHDAFGLITHNDGVLNYVPARQGKNHLHIVLRQLEQAKAEGNTNLAKTFNDLADRLKRRCLLVVLSDLFGGDGSNGTGADARELVDAIGHLRHKKHEVVVLHILDRAELTFPFDDATQIEDLETHRLVNSDAQAIRNHYLTQLNQYIDTVRRGCLSREVAYALADTSQPFDLFLGTYLTQRHHQRTKRLRA